jgi:hypothetical protein
MDGTQNTFIGWEKESKNAKEVTEAEAKSRLNPPKPDPGEGWRLVDKDVDQPQEGDEFWDREHCEWVLRHKAFSDSPFSEISTYRRRIEPPKPKTRTVVLREWLLWTSPGHECLQWLASDPLGWPHRHPTGKTRTIEVPE